MLEDANEDTRHILDEFAEAIKRRAQRENLFVYALVSDGDYGTQVDNMYDSDILTYTDVKTDNEEGIMARLELPDIDDPLNRLRLAHLVAFLSRQLGALDQRRNSVKKIMQGVCDAYGVDLSGDQLASRILKSDDTPPPEETSDGQIVH